MLLSSGGSSPVRIRQHSQPRLSCSDDFLPSGVSPNTSLLQRNSKNEDSSTEISADITFSLTDAEEDHFEEELAAKQEKIQREIQRWAGAHDLTPPIHTFVSEREKREKIKRAIKDWKGEEELKTEQKIKNAVKMWKGVPPNPNHSQNISSNTTNNFQIEGYLYLLEPTLKWKFFWFVLSSDAHLHCYRPTERKTYHTEFPRHNWYLGNANVSVQFRDNKKIWKHDSLPSDYLENMFSIEIYHKNGSRVKHVLAAPSNGQRVRWITAIDQAILCVPGSMLPKVHGTKSLGDIEDENLPNSSHSLLVASKTKSIGKEKKLVPIVIPKVKLLRRESLRLRKLIENTSRADIQFISVLVADCNSFVPGSLTIGYQESYIRYWNDYLSSTSLEHRSRLEIELEDVIRFGKECTVVCKRLNEFNVPGEEIFVSPDTARFEAFGNNAHHQEGIIVLPKGERFCLYFNATTPHAIHITYDGKSAVKAPQNYFVCPSQHWINGEHDKEGKLIRAFVCDTKLKRIKIRVTPLLRHDVGFTVQETQEEFNHQNLYKTPNESNLKLGTVLQMYSRSLSCFGNGDLTKIPKSEGISRILVVNRTRSRRHLISLFHHSTVKNAKEMLEALSDIPSGIQQLLCNGRILNDNETLINLDQNELDWEIKPSCYYSAFEFQENYKFQEDINEDQSLLVSEDERGLCAWDFMRSCELNLKISEEPFYFDF